MRERNVIIYFVMVVFLVVGIGLESFDFNERGIPAGFVN